MVSDTSTKVSKVSSKRRKRRKARRRVRQETGQEIEGPTSEVSSGEETETEGSVEEHSSSPSEQEYDSPGTDSSRAAEEEDEDHVHVQAAITVSVLETYGESGRGLLSESRPAILSDPTQSDYYAAIDGLLLRDPSDRAPFRKDHRGPELRGGEPGGATRLAIRYVSGEWE